MKPVAILRGGAKSPVAGSPGTRDRAALIAAHNGLVGRGVISTDFGLRLR